jgi:hypothetical protein
MKITESLREIVALASRTGSRLGVTLALVVLITGVWTVKNAARVWIALDRTRVSETAFAKLGVDFERLDGSENFAEPSIRFDADPLTALLQTTLSKSGQAEASPVSLNYQELAGHRVLMARLELYGEFNRMAQAMLEWELGEAGLLVTGLSVEFIEDARLTRWNVAGVVVLP